MNELGHPRPACMTCKWWGVEDVAWDRFLRRCGNTLSVEFRELKLRGDVCSLHEPQQRGPTEVCLT